MPTPPALPTGTPPVLPRLLVAEDSDTSAAVILAAVEGRYDVTRESTVGGAMSALRGEPPVAVVLDYVLDAPASELHDRLLAVRVPVLLVSGYESERAADFAAARGWHFLQKPYTDETFAAALSAALKGPPMTQPPRPTLAPPAADDPDADVPPAPEAPTRVPSDAPLHADPRTAQVDLISRRVLRGGVALLIAGLTVYGDATGHPVSALAVTLLAALGMGPDAAIAAMRKRPGVTAAGVAGMAALALGGSALDIPEAGDLAALGAAGATVLVDAVRGRG